MNILLELLLVLVCIFATFAVGTAIAWLIMKVVNYEIDTEMRKMKLRK